MLGQYLPIVCLMVLAVAFGALSFGASRLLAPRRPSSAKSAPYECGIVPSRDNPERFPVTFYVVAMLFVMFDIETDLHLPVRRRPGLPRQLRVLGDDRLQRRVLRCVRLRGGQRGAGVGSAAVRPPPAREPCRPSARSPSTIRRVGLEGRADEEASGVTDEDTGSSAGVLDQGWAGSSTTSSPAGWRTWSTGRGRAAAGRRTSGWPAAPSR